MSSIILGIDPGLAITGFGILDVHARDSQDVLAYGVIRTPAHTPLSERLVTLRNEFVALVEQYQPDMVAVEDLFFGKNVKTAMMVGHARGVVLLSIEEAGVPLVEYTPLQIKLALTGYGRADKKQMQQLVQQLLGLDKIPQPDDAADALAVALTAAVADSSFTSNV